MSKKIKNNRRKVVLAKKRARQAEQQELLASRRRHSSYVDAPPMIIGWLCTDPSCVEGIHHFDPSVDGDSSPEREQPRATNSGPLSDSSDCCSEGATSGHGTHRTT